MATAVVFPGQGSQRTGMALDFYENFVEAREIFEKASDTLGFDIKTICEDENDLRLHQTEYTQPCILTAEYAMYETLKKNFNLDAHFFGGHSLGEYTALVAAGVMPFEVAIELVHLRGKLMQWSMNSDQGGMAALIYENTPIPAKEIEELARSLDLDIANDNSPYQVVLSGIKNNLNEFAEKLKQRIAHEKYRFIQLTTSASFHSRHMKEGEKIFRKILISKAEHFNAQLARFVTSNCSGKFHTDDRDDLVDSLTKQISSKVRWQNNMCEIKKFAQTIIEIGPNRPLSQFFKAVETSVLSILDVRTAKRFLEIKPQLK